MGYTIMIVSILGLGGYFLGLLTAMWMGIH